MSNNVRVFEVKGVTMLGNFENGSVIGLDVEGLDFINSNYVFRNRKFNQAVVKQERTELDAAVHDLGFLNKEEDKVDSAYVHVTDACNLHCLGCYSFVEKRNVQNEMDTETLKRIFKSLSDVGVNQIVISGGEPFLRDDMDELCRFIKEECHIGNLSVITNGTLPHERYTQALEYIDELNISIDGYDEYTRFIRDKGIMDKVIRTVKVLRNHVNLNLIVTLHKKNIEHMDKYSDLAKNLNVSYSYSIFTVDENNPVYQGFLLTDKDLIEIERRLSSLNEEVQVNDVPMMKDAIYCRDRCEAGRKLISVDAMGLVYPCHMLHEEKLVLGDAKISSIKDIVFSESNPLLNQNVDDIDDCSGCEFKYLCGGGCRGRSYLKYGSFDKKDSYCAMISNFYATMMKKLKNQLET